MQKVIKNRHTHQTLLPTHFENTQAEHFFMQTPGHLHQFPIQRVALACFAYAVFLHELTKTSSMTREGFLSEDKWQSRHSDTFPQANTVLQFICCCCAVLFVFVFFITLGSASDWLLTWSMFRFSTCRFQSYSDRQWPWILTFSCFL